MSGAWGGGRSRRVGPCNFRRGGGDGPRDIGDIGAKPWQRTESDPGGHLGRYVLLTGTGRVQTLRWPGPVVVQTGEPPARGHADHAAFAGRVLGPGAWR